MRSKCINSIVWSQIVTGNGFSDSDFVYEAKRLAVPYSFLPILAIFTAQAQFATYFCFRLQFN